MEVYASSAGGGASNLNATGDHDLQQRIQRETRKTAGGGTIESTTTQSRSIADPSRFGAKEVERRVTRPTAGGETVETHSYEEGVNGKPAADWFDRRADREEVATRATAAPGQPLAGPFDAAAIPSVAFALYWPHSAPARW